MAIKLEHKSIGISSECISLKASDQGASCILLKSLAAVMGKKKFNCTSDYRSPNNATKNNRCVVNSSTQHSRPGTRKPNSKSMFFFLLVALKMGGAGRRWSGLLVKVGGLWMDEKSCHEGDCTG